MKPPELICVRCPFAEWKSYDIGVCSKAEKGKNNIVRKFYYVYCPINRYAEWSKLRWLFFRLHVRLYNIYVSCKVRLG